MSKSKFIDKRNKFCQIQECHYLFVTEYREGPIMDWGVPGWKRVI